MGNTLVAHPGTKVENYVRCLNSWVMFTIFIDLGKHRIKQGNHHIGIFVDSTGGVGIFTSNLNW